MLPEPAPGRPHHPSYTEPGPQMSLLELVVLIVAVVLIAFAVGGLSGEGLL
jgi:hypothetical protein